MQVFETTGKNKETVVVAGLSVSSGKLSRAHFFRVLRDDEVLVDRVKATSMRRHKDRVNEVTKDKVGYHRMLVHRLHHHGRVPTSKRFSVYFLSHGVFWRDRVEVCNVPCV